MKALIILDLQNDFCANGALEVEGSHEVVVLANQLMESAYFDVVVATQEWHPANHKSFAANHVFRYPGQTVALNNIQQRLWPIHCVQESFGSDFSSEFHMDDVDLVIQKGNHPEMDAYSPFYDNLKKDRSNLDRYLKEKEVQQVFVLGLNTEYSVKETAMDALNLGFEVFVVEDACRSTDWEDGDGHKAMEAMQAAGIVLLDSDQLIL